MITVCVAFCSLSEQKRTETAIIAAAHRPSAADRRQGRCPGGGGAPSDMGLGRGAGDGNRTAPPAWKVGALPDIRAGFDNGVRSAQRQWAKAQVASTERGYGAVAEFSGDRGQIGYEKLGLLLRREAVS